MNELTLEPCPWCGQTPFYVKDKTGVEIHCRYKLCRANPHISFMKGYSKSQVTVVWNSYSYEKRIIEKDKNPVKDLTKFKEYLSKKELCNLLIDANSCKEFWEKIVPEYIYMTTNRK